MSLTKTIAPILRCNGCRTAIVRSFTSISGPNAIQIPSGATRRQTRPLRRAFTISTQCNSMSKEKHLMEEEDGLLEGVNNPPAEPEAPSSSSTTSSPWYLSPQHQSSLPSFASAQPTQQQALPDLPRHPPPILSTLLNHISTDLGLDDLQLLDLRHLDPPSALGSNLIMLIGTARSAKHLHVSADRLCRYLRSTHKLRPYADGLLGRNEMKLKLRRKAKRMKMLANAGGAPLEESNIDDGIRTNWICCSVGRVEAHPEDDLGPKMEEMDGFVGFSTRKRGVSVVVQMFTEEKRWEVDLEGLWGGVERTAVREGRVRRGEEDVMEGEDVEVEVEGIVEDKIPEVEARRETPPEVSRVQHWPERMPSDAFPPVSNSDSARQLRRLHTVGLRPSLS